MFRTLPPVHSPLSLAAVGSGILAMLGRERAEDTVLRTLRGRFGPVDVVLTESGTAALTLALRAAARAGAVPVALPAYSCYDVATAAEGADVPVLLYDLDPATLSPDPGSLRKALELGARTVVVAHLFGIPADLAGVGELASAHGAVVIEDAAQGAGAALDGRALGSFGNLSVLSFGRGKGITAGRGGALLVRDAHRWNVTDILKDLHPARTAPGEPLALLAQWLLARPALYALPAALPFLGLGETRHKAPRPPRAMSAFSAGVLARTFALAGPEAAGRRAVARRLLPLLDERAGVIPVRWPAPADPGFLRLPVLVAPAHRARFRSPAARRLGVMPGYPGTLAGLVRLAGRTLNREADHPGATELEAALFTLPSHGQLTGRDLGALERWLGGAGRVTTPPPAERTVD